MLNQDIMREATRLTRAGQLTEATRSCSGLLRGESAPERQGAPIDRSNRTTAANS